MLNRRSFLAGALASTVPLADALAAESFRSLRKSPRMPVLFVGHGSPMNAIGDNAYRRSWQAMGAEFGAKHPTPQLILCVSAHWLTRGGWYLTGMPRPRTIHDVASQAHPTHEHYLPLLYAAGAVKAGESPRFFNTDFQSASISMRSVLWA